GNRLHGGVPGEWRETPSPFGSAPLQRGLQARPRIAQDPVIGNRTFATEGATIDRMVPVAPHPDNGALLLDDREATRIVTVPWAGGENDVLALWHGRSPSEYAKHLHADMARRAWPWPASRHQGHMSCAQGHHVP